MCILHVWIALKREKYLRLDVPPDTIISSLREIIKSKLPLTFKLIDFPDIIVMGKDGLEILKEDVLITATTAPTLDEALVVDYPSQTIGNMLHLCNIFNIPIYCVITVSG